MTRLLSILCLGLWLAGCAAQEPTTTAAADINAGASKASCADTYRGTASEKHCSSATCPDHK